MMMQFQRRIKINIIDALEIIRIINTRNSSGISVPSTRQCCDLWLKGYQPAKCEIKSIIQKDSRDYSVIKFAFHLKTNVGTESILNGEITWQSGLPRDGRSPLSIVVVLYSVIQARAKKGYLYNQYEW